MRPTHVLRPIKCLDFPPRKTRPVSITEDGNDKLCCPDCGGNYMHQMEVLAFNRFKEDGDGILTEVAIDGSAKIRPLTSTRFPVAVTL